ncbi:MAG TPA: preprotein translocase subunit SecG [Verrucomicrobiae bacterium]|nr:preprotein translocase subunit SecG [Verrucomicrobiae bacterium]
MGFVIGLLTLVMLLDCLVLVLLVLVQLPKKEAGAGLAFGGAASDALFGAGSGNVLTKITKYSATAFFVLAVALSLLQGNYHRRNTSSFQKKLEQSGQAPLTTAPPASTPSTKPSAPIGSTNIPLLTPEATNTPSTTSSNTASPK